VEHDQAVVEANVAIRQLQIVCSSTRQLRLDKILQIIAPIAETAAERKRQVQFFQQFVARHQAVEQTPWIAKLQLALALRADFAARPKRAEDKKWTCGHKRIPRRRRIKQSA